MIALARLGARANAALVDLACVGTGFRKGKGEEEQPRGDAKQSPNDHACDLSSRGNDGQERILFARPRSPPDPDYYQHVLHATTDRRKYCPFAENGYLMPAGTRNLARPCNDSALTVSRRSEIN